MTFCLVLVVNNDEKRIKQVLEPVIDLIDEYVLCDTGSTDNTLSIVTDIMNVQNIPGYVVKSSANEARNKAFTEARRLSDATYIMYLPSTDLIDKTNLEKQIRNLPVQGDNFTAKIMTGDTFTREMFIIRNNKEYNWKYPVGGEIRSYVPLTKINTEVSITRTITNTGINNDYITWFQNHVKYNDADDMAKLYLGFYLEKEEKHTEAISIYNTINEREIKYISHLRIGRIQKYKLNNYSEAQNNFVLGFNLLPERLECPHEFLCLLEITKQYNQGNPYIRTDAPYSFNGLMVEPCIYNWMYHMEASFIAHMAGDNETAIKIGTKLKEMNTYPSFKEEAVNSNLHFFRLALGLKDIKTESFGQFQIRTQRPQSIVIDNFFDNPDAVREFALRQDYGVTGNYPGTRTVSFADESHKRFLEKTLGRKITHWPGGYNGSFQFTTAAMKSWIHRDMTDYSAMIYLTPNAPLDAGTRIYRHKASGLTYANGKENEILDTDSGNEAAWDVVEEVRNLYNRCIIFDGRRSHKSHEYFGNNLEDGRLFMIFFFDVEK